MRELNIIELFGILDEESLLEMLYYDPKSVNNLCMLLSLELQLDRESFFEPLN